MHPLRLAWEIMNFNEKVRSINGEHYLTENIFICLHRKYPMLSHRQSIYFSRIGSILCSTSYLSTGLRTQPIPQSDCRHCVEICTCIWGLRPLIFLRRQFSPVRGSGSGCWLIVASYEIAKFIGCPEARLRHVRLNGKSSDSLVATLRLRLVSTSGLPTSEKVNEQFDIQLAPSSACTCQVRLSSTALLTWCLSILFFSLSREWVCIHSRCHWCRLRGIYKSQETFAEVIEFSQFEYTRPSFLPTRGLFATCCQSCSCSKGRLPRWMVCMSTDPLQNAHEQDSISIFSIF